MTIGDQPAFPVTASELNPPYPGMTYRQWLVGQIANGIASRPSVDQFNPEENAYQCTVKADAIIKWMEQK